MYTWATTFSVCGTLSKICHSHYRESSDKDKELTYRKELLHTVEILSHAILSSDVRHTWEVVNGLPRLYVSKSFVDRGNINPVNADFGFQLFVIYDLPETLTAVQFIKLLHVNEDNFISTIWSPEPDSIARFALSRPIFICFRWSRCQHAASVINQRDVAINQLLMY